MTSKSKRLRTTSNKRGNRKEKWSFVVATTIQETKYCQIYSSRPGIWRYYPRDLLDHPSPTFLPGCGYWVQAIHAEKIGESFDELDLSNE